MLVTTTSAIVTSTLTEVARATTSVESTTRILPWSAMPSAYPRNVLNRFVLAKPTKPVDEMSDAERRAWARPIRREAGTTGVIAG
jgi:hypothetical protein